MGRIRGKRNRDQDRYWHERRKATQEGMVGALDVPLCVFCGTLTSSDEAVSSCQETVCCVCAKERGLLVQVRVCGSWWEIANEFVDWTHSDRGGPGGSYKGGGTISGLSIDVGAVENSGAIPKPRQFRRVNPVKERQRALARFAAELKREELYRQRYPRTKAEVPRKFTDEQALAIRQRYALGGVSFVALGREYGATGTFINAIVTGAVYRSAGGPIHRPRTWYAA